MKEYNEMIKRFIEEGIKNNKVQKVSFYFSPLNIAYEVLENICIKKIAKSFEKMGATFETVENVPGSFSKNRTYLKVSNIPCIVNNRGAFPINMDIQDSTYITEAAEQGMILISVFHE